MQPTGRSVALVTGAGSGIGRAVAERLAAFQVNIGALGRTADELKETVTTIRSRGGNAVALEADIADEKQMRAAVAQLIATYGRLDIVVANAGVNGVWAPIDDLKPFEWDNTIEVNLRGTYLTLHFCVPHLKAAGAGAIVIVSSINGTRTFTTPGATAYAATKAAQLAIAQQLALELGKYHIRVNAVCPGAIKTSIGDNSTLRGKAETAVPVEWPDGDIPLTGGEPGEPEQVAAVIQFLVSNDAKHVTGTPIWVDGGQGLLR
ncbi:SDR family oxidoreductase (plasmid) [Ensifer adhaerens]|uniref:SDR family oxidoreductase n=1 Tax=Ensifer adhaerens TaxID=106592 RepID=UPI001CBEAA69|nr:SDR family NAD(P)-dependent oxidoreductase [Ensifer adhaerens]MBZ7927645.1 SDR family oxidoreductase [Ensifer adhaerens]UAX98041.1 SDR family oxidoreductase [Ensifer adhaerens]UAY05422.1 SDR family oxidoreductase [Ensifer adhaerens]UAY12800.1 SDR family oxidoreductase [Ensifer adhaerens]